MSELLSLANDRPSFFTSEEMLVSTQTLALVVLVASHPFNFDHFLRPLCQYFITSLAVKSFSVGSFTIGCYSLLAMR